MFGFKLQNAEIVCTILLIWAGTKYLMFEYLFVDWEQEAAVDVQKRSKLQQQIKKNNFKPQTWKLHNRTLILFRRTSISWPSAHFQS